MPSKIKVNVYLHSILVKYSADGKTRRFAVSLPDDSTITDLISHLGIQQSDHHLLLAVNGKVAKENQILEANDSVHLMMPISGGREKVIFLYH